MAINWIFYLRVLLFFALFQAYPGKVRAQSAGACVFRNTATGARYVVQPKDYLRVWASDERGNIRKYTGRLLRMENGQIYLKRRPPIALDQVQKIVYRPTPLRRALLWMLVLSILLLDAGAIAGLAALASEKALQAAGWLFGFGFGLFFLWLSLNIFTLRRMEQVNINWEMELVADRLPAMQPLP
ncbi:MAG: hypothetical protein IPH12_16990 [Saprospirales bacterium]|nr:hypothetical protein [Saprospirales bacterium]MBK8922712.1 hypothetical protein [Saprospirales bacterium]